jgi:DNA-binding FadR family transcriptional regulator
MDNPTPKGRLYLRMRSGVTRGLHNSVAHELGCMIIGGRLKPGEKLPNDDQFSAQLAVSRTAYREGIRTLTAKGLVETRPKVGTKIAPRANWSMLDPDVLDWHLEVKPSRRFIDSLFELRQIMEPAAAALTAHRRTELDLREIRLSFEEMELAPPGSQQALEADIEFHRALLKATYNEPLIAMSPVIESTMRWSVRLTLEAFPDGHGGSLPDHRAVLDAVAIGDDQAARERMMALVTTARANLLRSLDSIPP